jgi:hypothetical protein
MIGAATHPVPDRIIQATVPNDFYHAFLAITNPVSQASVLGSIIFMSG